jgi:ADP-heptose:LPS heptosyltransferase
MPSVPQNQSGSMCSIPFSTALAPTSDTAPDCRHYHGDRPCLHNRLCSGCTHYQPYSGRICVIKLGALGDVIRTLCILPELRRRHPAAHITWVSLPNGCRMIQSHPMLDRVLEFDPVNALVLQQESFDLVVSLDKEPAPCALAMSLFARRKLGVGLGEHGTPVPLNPEARAYFALGLSDELKFRHNTKSYPQLVYEALGWQYRAQRYELPLQEAQRDRMRLFLASRGWRPGQATLGVNVGAGRVFANKMWPAPRLAEAIRKIKRQQPGLQVVLLGGPDERPVIDAVQRDLEGGRTPVTVIDGGTEHSEPAFVGLVDACDVLFSGDTMAMHVALALGKGVVAWLGPTCAQEIDLFGLGEKLVAKVPCAPCYKRVCDQNDVCLEAVLLDAAAEAILRVLARCRAASSAQPLRKAG